MASTIDPGATSFPHLGNNYAQPSLGLAAVPGGHQAQTTLDWSGRANEGAPQRYDMTTNTNAPIAAELQRAIGELFGWVGSKPPADAVQREYVSVAHRLRQNIDAV
ncbi:MAG: hypothetical protein SF069_00030 [Phycisphaerae bacterium]|nr:hypothetical protein [Phycisphaerae bacterium]